LVNILTLPLLVVSLVLLHQEDEDLPENLDKVNEQIERVGNEVLVTIASLPDDDLGVEHDESTEDCQPNVNMCLEQKLRPEEDVGEAQHEEGGEARHEGASEIEILAIWSKQSGSSKASKHGRGDHEGGGDQGGVHHDGHLQEGTQAKTSQECKAEKHSHAHPTVLPIVRGHEEAKGKSCSQEREQDSSSLKEGGEQVHVGPCCSRHHGHGEAGIDVLQVGSNIAIKLGVE